MLAEECTQIRQHATRHHHLLVEKQSGIQKDIMLLHLPKLVISKTEYKGYHH